MINEHKLLPHSLNFLDSIDINYTSYAYADTSVNLETYRCGKGGVAILCRKDIGFNITQLECNQSERIIGVELKTMSNESIFIFSVYLPANNNIDEYKYELNILNDYINFYSQYGYVIIGGDFNTSVSERDLCHTNVYKSAELSDLILNNNNRIIPVNLTNKCSGSTYTFTTRKTTLDYVLIDEMLNTCVKSCTVVEEGTLANTSDHLPIIMSIDIPVAPTTTRARDHHWPSWHKATEADINSYRTLTENNISLNNLSVSSDSDIDAMAQTLTELLITTAQSCIPHKSFNQLTKPYWNNDVKIAHRTERLARQFWISEGRPRGHTFPSYTNYKYAKNKFRACQRNACETYMHKTFELLKT